MKVDNNQIEYIYKFDKDNKGETNPNNRNALDKDAFLKLLTVQLSNQDPLNPMEDREFIAQLAQFSTLEQMQNLNVTINAKSEELVDLLDEINSNQIDANIEILKEIINIRKAVEAYGIEDKVISKDSAEEVNTEDIVEN